MHLDAFHFDLPEVKIARYPLEGRSQSRLMVLDDRGRIHHSRFHQLLAWLRPHDLLIFNNSRVCKARLRLLRENGKKISGFFTRTLLDDQFEALLKPAKEVSVGECLQLESDSACVIRVLARLDQGAFILASPNGTAPAELLIRHGEVPIPPYLKRPAEPIDADRYQTLYGETEGSVAASTAGLHFDQSLLRALSPHQIDSAFVTLHIGLGTFASVRVEVIEEHVMHEESFSLPAETVEAVHRCRQKGGRVIAVGTSVLRVLESMAASGQLQSGCGETQLFIHPGFQFRVADALLTNFHLPKSTLMMLVAGFIGLERLKNLYAVALEHDYRFLSYGDAMLLPLFQEERS